MNELADPPPSPHETLELMFILTRPAIRQAIQALRLPAGSRGMDAGCGAGCHTDLLLQSIGPAGRLTALDMSEDNLAWAREHHGSGISLSSGSPVERTEGDILALDFPVESFDWIWCADTLWPGVVTQDPVATLQGFRRITRPGGTVALAYWSSQTLLPGYPGLEASLNAAFVDTVPYLSGVPPESSFLRAAAWLAAAGFERPRVQTFAADVYPPFPPAERRALAACFAMFWDHLADRVSSADWEMYGLLCDPHSPAFVGDAPGYHAFLTYTMFWAKRPAAQSGAARGQSVLAGPA